jgi:hypothetical protein
MLTGSAVEVNRAGPSLPLESIAVVANPFTIGRIIALRAKKDHVGITVFFDFFCKPPLRPLLFGAKRGGFCEKSANF